MIRLYDFRCPSCNNLTERFTQAETTHVGCDCGSQAARIISGGKFILPGNDTAYPTAHSKWVKEHERAGNIHNQHRTP